jgi:5-methylcytosine-specific restriction protein A
MTELFERILSNYKASTAETFTRHPIGILLRQDLPEAIRSVIAENNRYKVKGSAGATNWAEVPWVAIFDIIVTVGAKNGYYPVFLFREDMAGFYLSLNQGVTSIKEQYPQTARERLVQSASDFRSRISEFPVGFVDSPIAILKGRRGDRLGGWYELGNVISKFYPADNLPDEQTIIGDILAILKVYAQLVYGDNLSNLNDQPEFDEDAGWEYENLQRFRMHKRFERNATLVAKVKGTQGYMCAVCGFDFEEQYGRIGHQFIEAHHLVPFGSLVGQNVRLDPRSDFAVLCSNCHRMAHRLDDPGDIGALRALLKQVRKKA